MRWTQYLINIWVNKMRSVSLHILDLVQNSIAAGADLIEAEIIDDSQRAMLSVCISDNGKGLSAEQAENAFDPFFTTKGKKTGLGLPLFKASCEKSGGEAELKSRLGIGTKVKGIYHTDSIDYIGENGLNNTLALLAVTNPQADFIFKIKRDKKQLIIDTREIKNKEEIASLGINNYKSILESFNML